MPYALKPQCICCRKEYTPAGDDRYCPDCIERNCCVCVYTDCGRPHRNPCRADRDTIRTAPTTVTRNGAGELVIRGEPATLDAIRPAIERIAANAPQLGVVPAAA